MEVQEVRPKRVCSPRYAVQKAKKGKTLNRWEIEDLAKDPEQSFIYASKVLKGRFPEGEAAIAESSFAYQYAKHVIEGRFEAAEPHFIKCLERMGSVSRSRALDYFVSLAGVRNPLVEKHLLEHEHNRIVAYCQNCIGGRWEEAEGKIVRFGACEYHEHVLKDRWPALEDRIIREKKLQWHESRKEMMKGYLKVVPNPGPEFERKLEKSNRASLLLVYAMKGLRGKLPQTLHQKMMMFSFDPKRQSFAKKYLKFVSACERRVVRFLSGLDEDERNEIMAKVCTNPVS